MLTLLRELNKQSRLVKHTWDSDSGEVVVCADMSPGDGKLTQEQFQDAVRAFLQAIDQPGYGRIKTTADTGVDPGVPVRVEPIAGLESHSERKAARKTEPRESGSSADSEVLGWLAALGRARGVTKNYVATPYTPDAVDCAVFSQREVPPGDCVLVQVFAYMPGYVNEAGDLAAEYDEEAKRLGSVSLTTEIMRGSMLTFELVIRDVAIHDPVQNLLWRGKTQSVQFEVSIPSDCGSKNLIGKVLISQDTVPIGQILFKIKVVSREVAADTTNLPTGDARRYRMAFISYASKDRPEVLRRVQMLTAVGMRYFQDVVDLDPGDRWAQELYRHIDQSDVLFLFWSTAARESEWVRREWQYGLERKGEDFIHPVIIEGPPPPEPPPELAHLHFADKMLYFINAS